MRKQGLFTFIILLVMLSPFAPRSWSKEAPSGKEKKSTTRYRAKIVRKTLAPEGDPLTEPILRFPEDKNIWKIVRDEASTGNNRHEYFFTIEADGEKQPDPKIELIWPGVDIAMKSIDLLSRKSTDLPWTFILNVAADDNRDKAILQIKITFANGKTQKEVYPYDIDTGRILE